MVSLFTLPSSHSSFVDLLPLFLSWLLPFLGFLSFFFAFFSPPWLNSLTSLNSFFPPSLPPSLLRYLLLSFLDFHPSFLGFLLTVHPCLLSSLLWLLSSTSFFNFSLFPSFFSWLPPFLPSSLPSFLSFFPFFLPPSLTSPYSASLGPTHLFSFFCFYPYLPLHTHPLTHTRSSYKRVTKMEEKKMMDHTERKEERV